MHSEGVLNEKNDLESIRRDVREVMSVTGVPGVPSPTLAMPNGKC